MYLFFIIFVHYCMWLVQGEYGAYLVSNKNTGKAKCILTGEATRSAVAWTTSASQMTNLTNENVKPTYSSPPIMESRFKCSFEDNCREKWNNGKDVWFDDVSYKYSFAPRTDSAWNGLKQLFSKGSDFAVFPKSNIFQVSFNKANEATISISVKVASNAHVAFCAGDKFFQVPCYMVILAGFEENKVSVIRKCEQGIPKKYAEPGTSCYVPRASSINVPPLVDDRLWSHFTFILNKTSSGLSLKVLAKVPEDSRFRPILQYEDPDPIEISHWGVRSYTQNSFWKIHNYKFLWTKSEKTNGILYFGEGNPYKFPYSKNELCLKMAVVLCPACSFQLHVQYDDMETTSHSKVIHGKDRPFSNGLLQWIEEKFNMPLEKHTNLKLRFSTTVEDGTADPFWAIDDVRECTPDENKILMFPKNYTEESCQIIDEEVSNRTKDYNFAILMNKSNAEDCSNWFGGTSCKGIQISSANNGGKRCFLGYNGRNCEDTTILHTKFEILKSQFENLVIKPRGLNASGTTARYMSIQYQYHCDCFETDPWKDMGEVQPISDYENEFIVPPEIATDKLIKGKDLLIRIILYVDGKMEFGIPLGQNITPTCKENKSLFKYSATANNITITQELRQENDCPLVYYNMEIVDSSTTSYRLHNQTIFEYLEPFTEYTIVFTGKWNETFSVKYMTGDAAPGPVEELRVYSRESDSLSLRWKPPRNTKGIIQNYTIAYANMHNLRRHSVTRGSSCELWDDYICATITALTNSFYNIQVYAHTRNPSEGKTTQRSVQTGQGAPSEPLDLKQKNQNTTEISWKHPWFPNGKVEYFEIEFILKSSGLKKKPMMRPMNKIKEIKHPMKEYTYMYNGLAPATTYSIKVTAYNTLKGKPSEINITTPLVAPHVTGEIKVQRLPRNQMEITIPIPQENVTEISGFYIVVSEIDPKESDVEKMRIEKEHKMQYVDIRRAAEIDENKTISWIAKHVSLPNETVSIQTIGVNDNSGGNFWDGPLSEKSTYTIAVVYYNEWNETKRYTALFNNKIKDLETNYALWSLLLLLLIPAVLFFVYKRYKTKIADPSPNHGVNQESVLLNELPNEPSRAVSRSLSSRICALKPSFKILHKTRLVAIEDFESYVKESLRNGELEKQHKMFKRALERPATIGMRKENKSKNRYLNMIPYDDTRVILEKLPGDPNSDYINANFVDGYNHPKAYIASQGPKENTVDDFWRMVWQEKVTVICMLTNTEEGDKIKCHQYWPTQGANDKYGQISVHHDKSVVYVDFIHRTFSVIFGNTRRTVDHLHFVSWPDHGVPHYPRSVVAFIEKFQNIQTESPTVIHCSAGVGRTGTIILADICLKMAEDVGKVDVLHYQKLIRDQRANLVDNKDQYKLVHMILVERLCGEQTSIPCSELRNKVNEMRRNNTLLNSWKDLDEHSWKDNFTKNVDDGPTAEDLKRKGNRNNIVPGVRNRVFLPRFPVHVADSDYINAVYVDGFRVKDQFIVTQFPLAHTVADYWRMISDKDITLVAVLNEIDTRDETVKVFVPNKAVRVISPIPQISVHYQNSEETTFCSIVDVTLRDETKPEETISRNIKIVQLKNWKSKQELPSWGERNQECLLTLWEQLEKLISGPEPVLITCYDGATGCGLFTALTFVIEKIKLEHECDVPLAVRTVRRHRQEMLRSGEQYNFLFDAAICFLEGFDIYSNFS